MLLSNLASGVLFVVLPLLVLKENSGPLLATLIIVAPLLAQTFASFLWGALSDRLGRRREILVAGALGAAILYVFFPLVSPPVLLLLRTLQAALIATSTLVYALSSEGSTGSVGIRLGNMMAWSNVGSLIGLVVVFPLLTLQNLDSPLGWDLIGVLALATALSALLLASAGDLPRLKATVSLRNILKFRKGLKIVYLSAATFPLAVGNYVAYTTLPVYLNDGLGSDGFFGWPMNSFEQLAIYSIVTTAIAIPLCVWVGPRVEGIRWRRIALVLTPLGYAAFWLSYAFTSSYLVFFVIWAVPLYPILSLAATREITDMTVPEERGRGIGMWNAVYTLGGLLGGTIAGITLQGGDSYREVFLIGTVLSALGAVTLCVVIVKSLQFSFRGPSSATGESKPIEALPSIGTKDS
jgi:MFS family permease